MDAEFLKSVGADGDGDLDEAIGRAKETGMAAIHLEALVDEGKLRLAIIRPDGHMITIKLTPDQVRGIAESMVEGAIHIMLHAHTGTKQ